ncbi:unnamed protein product [Cylindrotheca closterium]|uniref:Uncharacterized protein n=1 Tax=Cylindrotheca closterium TaxID=2856 RepID=A0AAD2FQ58_9STRA|nr:unnamed protein product [Cylindrotheca closterium]
MTSSSAAAFLQVRSVARSHPGFGIASGDFAASLSAIGTEGIETLPAEAATVFEPIAPPTESLIGFGIIAILCVILYKVWSEQVVPVSRTKLAISKSRGEVKEYLDELKASEEEFDGVPSNSTEMPPTTVATKDDRGFERWLFTDWLIDNKSERQAGRQKEPALPILKNAKWNSGDNPVLAATALLSMGLILSAVTERVASFGH